MLTKNKVLTSLELVDCGLGPEGLCNVFNAVSINTTLTSLDISHGNFNDEDDVFFNHHQHCVQSLGRLLMLH